MIDQLALSIHHLAGKGVDAGHECGALTRQTFHHDRAFDGNRFENRHALRRQFRDGLPSESFQIEHHRVSLLPNRLDHGNAMLGEPVVEFGIIGETAHKVDENVAVADVRALTDIYQAVLDGFFAEAAEC